MRFLIFPLLFVATNILAQVGSITGIITNENDVPMSFVNVLISADRGTTTDDLGKFSLTNIPVGPYELSVTFLGYEDFTQQVTITENQSQDISISLSPDYETLEEIVVTGTMKAMNRLDSPVPVEVYTPAFFKKNPTTNMYEALQNINGVRPQLNCAVCNTGSIQINGLEGPYTMVLIDGMPIVSSLATVYGLSGIPNALIERMEIVKGPASSLYGSEAIGGLINLITKNAAKAPQFTADLMTTSWVEHNIDLGVKLSLNDKINILTGVNYFNYDNPIDNNDDNITDVTLQARVSVFQKWNIQRKDNRLFSIAGRYYYEDRWGGELQWSPEFRGGDQIYGESIYTERFELLGQYQLPTKNTMMLSFSLNTHQQNSVYGDVPYIGDQKIGFTQLTWNKNLSNHDLLIGSALRYTYYDDNTTATSRGTGDGMNDPNQIWLPGIFFQDEIKINEKQNLLLGLRYDYNNVHDNIVTPRIAYKWSPSPTDIFRLNAGTGFRVVNLFTEDHAALTGAREVVITEELKPEQSYNVNMNYTKKLYMENGGAMSFEFSTWYTHFTNVILPDYETNTNQIIYDNLNGSAVTKGISLNADMSLSNGISLNVGATFMDVSTEENNISERQILTERFTGTWSVSYKVPNGKWSFDYTGNIYGPMRLPLLSDLDPRPEESPWWSLQNIQATYKAKEDLQFYGGVKNLLNWTPWKNQDQPIIARSFDPFDREVSFIDSGEAITTPNNPYALTFDPSYVYAPNQGIRLFFGVRYTLR